MLGIDIRRENSISKLKKMLQDFDSKLLDMQNEVEEFIEKIEDSQTRKIFRFRYIDDYEWYKIALDCEYSGESGARMKHDRFLDKI